MLNCKNIMIKSKESINFLKVFYKKPKYLKGTLRFLYFFITLQVAKRLKNHIKISYPDRALIMLKNSAYQLSSNKVDSSTPLGFSFEYKTSLFSFQAFHDFKWINLFNKEVEDQEVLCSAARWYWLIYDFEILNCTSVDRVLLLTKHWIRSFSYDESSLTWEPYNASERISSFANAIIFQSSFNNLIDIIKREKEISDFLNLSVYHISRNLEYYPNKISYNHVVNDLKGILTAAILLEDDSLVSNTSDLLFTELELLVNSEGFIREGSSHYQFIVTRWIVELEWLCMLSNRDELRVKFKQWNIKLLNSSVFYLVKDETKGIYNIPFFGDVSPDFDPEWIINYFGSVLTCCDNNIINSYGYKIFSDLGYLFLADKSVDISVSCEFFTRINQNDITLFIRHQSHGQNFFPNHAHDDFTSYVLFYKGKCIVSDPGRINYMLSNKSIEYLLSTSHNVIQVEGLPIQTSELNRHFLPGVYKQNDSNIYFSVIAGNQQLSIKSNSFSRLQNKDIASYTRVFSFCDNVLVITDEFSGSGSYYLTGQIHLSPNVTIEQNNKNAIRLKCNNLDNSISIHFVNLNLLETEKSRNSERYQVESNSLKLNYASSACIPTLHQLEFKFY